MSISRFGEQSLCILHQHLHSIENENYMWCGSDHMALAAAALQVSSNHCQSSHYVIWSCLYYRQVWQCRWRSPAHLGEVKITCRVGGVIWWCATHLQPSRWAPIIVRARIMSFDRVYTIGRCGSVGGGHLHTWERWKLHVVWEGSYGGVQHTCSSPGELQSLSELALCHLIVIILSAGVAVLVEVTCILGFNYFLAKFSYYVYFLKKEHILLLFYVTIQCMSMKISSQDSYSRCSGSRLILVIFFTHTTFFFSQQWLLIFSAPQRFRSGCANFKFH